MRAAVFGLGSAHTGGAGVEAVRLFEKLFDYGEDVTVAELWTPGADLTARMAGFDAIILIDAVDAGAPPGTVRLYGKEALHKMPAQPRASPHDPALKEALLALELLDEMPPYLVLVGIVPGAPPQASGPVADAVRQGIEEAAHEVAVQLDGLGFDVRPSAANWARGAFPNSYEA